MNVNPRKSPRQARAKATVEAIVEAAAQVLLADGYDRCTTAGVAERAGVSIGSLYQYFPNKAALAAAVVEHCCDDFRTQFTSALAARRHGTLAESIRAMVDAALVSHRLTPERHRLVRELAPRLGVVARTEQVSRTTAEAIAAMLRHHAAELAPDLSVTAAATVIETILETLAHRAVTAHPAHLDGAHLPEEATRLVTGYLLRPPPRRRKPGTPARRHDFPPHGPED